jgi:hypothetical protein
VETELEPALRESKIRHHEDDAVAGSGRDLIRRIADAVLYEGYLLWPYSKSALKNQQRFTFGGVYPPAFEDSSSMQAQVLLEGDEHVEVEVRVRFLHVVERQVLKIDRVGAPDGESLALPEPVEELEADGERFVTWDEAVEREVAPGPIRIAADEELAEVSGGMIRRSWQALQGEVALTREPLRAGLSRVTVRIANTTPWADGDGDGFDTQAGSGGNAEPGTSIGAGAGAGAGAGERAQNRAGARQDALRRTFCSTHASLRATGGAWVSLTDPPTDLRSEAKRCENIGLWPVLVGEPGDRNTLLASPIILADHPEIAPESPGDLFDSGEIDQMLVLNILAMTEQERRDMRDSDPRAREILKRTEALSDEEIMRLNGAVREFGLVRAR